MTSRDELKVYTRAELNIGTDLWHALRKAFALCGAGRVGEAMGVIGARDGANFPYIDREVDGIRYRFILVGPIEIGEGNVGRILLTQLSVGLQPNDLPTDSLYARLEHDTVADKYRIQLVSRDQYQDVDKKALKAFNPHLELDEWEGANGTDSND